MSTSRRRTASSARRRRERYSVAFFLDPNPDAVVACLPTCTSPDRPARYPPITAADYLTGRPQCDLQRPRCNVRRAVATGCSSALTHSASHFRSSPRKAGTQASLPLLFAGRILGLPLSRERTEEGCDPVPPADPRHHHPVTGFNTLTGRLKNLGAGWGPPLPFRWEKALSLNEARPSLEKEVRVTPPGVARHFADAGCAREGNGREFASSRDVFPDSTNAPPRARSLHGHRRHDSSARR